MHWLFWVFSCVIFGIGYRLGYKLVSTKFSPLFNVAVITLVVSLLCFTLYFLRDYGKGDTPALTVKELWPLITIGVIMAGLEVSWMMLYKSGGPISISHTIPTSMVGIAMFTIGIFFFKEQLNMGQIIGFVLGLSGVSIMTYASRS
ncbi:MAG: EamA family transporter [Alphaproteobacteria bacterium]|nr:EamA family transporter [Alphaproteobacteria bacterium]MDD9919366.1 EamA family transporter [Alphaproteobacteria bacterium]